jgi:hypothetical protein
MPTGVFASEFGDLGVWRQATNAKNPQLASAYAIHDATVYDCGRSNRKMAKQTQFRSILQMSALRQKRSSGTPISPGGVVH